MNQILKYVSCFLGVFYGLGAEMHLDRLIEYDEKTCLEALQKAELSDLWDAFLRGQTKLFFDEEIKLFKEEKEWQKAKNVLELGSGNGSYLARLADTFQEKTYLGIEKQSNFIQEATHQLGRPGLAFIEGDAEIEYECYKNQFDMVLFRFTLQHLANPRLALELAYRYLKEDGYVLIIDSYDPAKMGSYNISSLKEATRQHQERNEAERKANRFITMEILEELQKEVGPLSHLYQINRTSLDNHGNRLEPGIRLEGERSRRQFFSHALLFLTIFQKGYGVVVDLAEAYEELQVYLTDETAWICPGIHFLVLKKI
jgi:ubiquinone/menaquinone biosynthesis C-methylase UbiE